MLFHRCVFLSTVYANWPHWLPTSYCISPSIGIFECVSSLKPQHTSTRNWFKPEDYLLYYKPANLKPGFRSHAAVVLCSDSRAGIVGQQYTKGRSHFLLQYLNPTTTLLIKPWTFLFQEVDLWLGDRHTKYLRTTASESYAGRLNFLVVTILTTCESKHPRFRSGPSGPVSWAI
jgi:hypothetical protein